MVELGKRREPCALVVGAGLTGACLAWLIARAGQRVTLLSTDRPASQATSLAPGIVHGLGPPGGPEQWERIDDHTLSQALGRANTGFQLLQEVLLSATRLSGYRPCEHRLTVPENLGYQAAEQVCQRLRTAGFPIEFEQPNGQLRFVRRRDAIVHLRGLTFEILRQARTLGAKLRFGEEYRGFLEETPRGLLVGIGSGEELFGKIYWAGGSPVPGDPEETTFRSRMVIHQVLASGEKPLEKILETADGDLLLTPRVDGSEGVVLVRYARGNPGGGLDWPTLPESWNCFCGPAWRQRLSETMVGLPSREFGSSGLFVPMSGFSGWPVTSLMGACQEVVPAANDL